VDVSTQLCEVKAVVRIPWEPPSVSRECCFASRSEIQCVEFVQALTLGRLGNGSCSGSNVAWEVAQGIRSGHEALDAGIKTVRVWIKSEYPVVREWHELCAPWAMPGRAWTPEVAFRMA
jgi:hypothetical protein